MKSNKEYIMEIPKDSIGTTYPLKKDIENWAKVFDLREVGNERVIAQITVLKNIQSLLSDGMTQCDATVTGIAIDKDDKVILKNTPMSENGLNAEYLMSGHTGRTYFDMPEGLADEILQNITIIGEESKLSYTPKEYYVSTDPERVVYPRFAATHGAHLEKGKITEDKLKPLVAAMGGMQNYGFGTTTHFGLDVPMMHKIEKSFEGKIRNDGEIGHMYINIERLHGRSALGFGLEGSAPTKGNHSMSGGADRYTAFGGPKCYVKIDKGDKHFNGYVKDFIDQHFAADLDQVKEKGSNVSFVLPKNMPNPTKITNAILQAKTEIDAEFQKNPNQDVSYKTIEMGEGKDAKNINIVRMKGDKNVYLLTDYAINLLKEGKTIPKYVGGTTIRVDMEQHKGFIKTHAPKFYEKNYHNKNSGFNDFMEVEISKNKSEKIEEKDWDTGDDLIIIESNKGKGKEKEKQLEFTDWENIGNESLQKHDEKLYEVQKEMQKYDNVRETGDWSEVVKTNKDQSFQKKEEEKKEHKDQIEIYK